ncbi:acetylpolyamine amidohydrolase AphA [soil metagenome]
MKTVYSLLHHEHAPEREFFRGNLVECFEKPDRALKILQEIRKRSLGEIVTLPAPTVESGNNNREEFFDSTTVIEPDADLLRLIKLVHKEAYISFVRTIFQEWRQVVPTQSYALPHTFNRLAKDRAEPASPYAKLGYYSFDTGTPITAGTWNAAIGSAWCAFKGQEIVRKEGMAFALCRPPGHHAHWDMCGGYCFFNNAAIAAAAFRAHDPTATLAILDVDYHHGNGTQSIFYDRADVFFASIHGDPTHDYPYFLGYADETGGQNAPGQNANFPLPRGTTWDQYTRVLDTALEKIESQNPQYLIVSLGVDTFRGDAISEFLLESEDFIKLGRQLGKRHWPTLFVMEGGYHDEIGINVANVLQGFQAAYREEYEL